MKVIVDIDDAYYKTYKAFDDTDLTTGELAIKNGVILPENATNGNIFCLFNKVSRVIELRDCVEVEVEVRPHIIWTSKFDKEWWDAPYIKKRGNNSNDN